MDLYHCSICKCPLAADMLCTARGSIQQFCRDPREGGENKGHQPLLTALRGTRNNPKETRAQSSETLSALPSLGKRESELAHMLCTGP